MARWSDLTALVRWPGAVTAGTNAATGFLLAHRPESPTGWLDATGAVAGAVLLYAGGVVLNDVADAARDVELHPSRPIPSGRVGRATAARFGAALLVAGVAIAALLANPAAGAIAAVAAVAATLYDFALRRVRLAGAAFLGVARAANAAAGAVAGAGDVATPLSVSSPSLAGIYPVALFAYTAILVWISTYEDATPGARPRWLPGFLAISLALAAAVPWRVFPRTVWAESPAIPLLLLLGTLVIAAREAMDGGAAGIGRIVRAGVFGFVLVDSAWLFGSGRYEAGFWLLLVYVGLRAILARARS